MYNRKGAFHWKQKCMFDIDRFSNLPVYAQIVEQVTRFVASGVLNPGDPLPSVRALSAQLSVNPNTLQKAYMELDNRGLTCAVPGSGRYIAADAREKLLPASQKGLAEFTRLSRSLMEGGVPRETLEQILSQVYERSSLC